MAFSRFTTLDSISADNLKTGYLKDIRLVDRDGRDWDEGIYNTHLQNAIVEFERETKIIVLAKTIKNEPHDYHVEDYLQFAWLQLFEWPVQSVEGIRAIYPTGQKAQDFPPEWVKLQPEHGQIQMVPTQGSLSQVVIGQGGSFLPLIYNGLSMLPHLWYVDYTAGFKADQIPWDVYDCIMKLAAIEVLTIAADTVNPPGVTNISLGVDGLSQSTGFMNNGQMPPVFTGRIKLYRAMLYGGQGVGDSAQQGKLASLRDQYRGIHMTVA